MDFLVTLAIAITTTGLVSRLLFQVLSAWNGDLKPFAIHVWSFILCGLLFVLWCSVPDAPLNWFAAHKVFFPQAAWFISDVLRSTGQHEPEEHETIQGHNGNGSVD